MEALKYLHPDNLIAKAIVDILVGMFLLWVAGLTICWIWLWLQHRRMRRCSDVQLLTDSQEAWTLRRSGSDEEPGALLSTTEAEAAFNEFCEAKEIKPRSVISRHVKAIFVAGWTEGRLEVGELIKHTTNELFRSSGWLRSLLATFIVFGLLGTLFGLADSLSQLSPVAPGSNSHSNEALSQGLNNLLTQLKSAFAPSIWGIAFTILGVILFTLFLQFACSPVKNTLERLTLTVWVPELFPNTTQRLQETLRLSEQQIYKNLQAINEVADFSKSIRDEVGDLNQSFKSANKALKLLAKSSEQINAFADRFVEGVGVLEHFEGDLRALYSQMVSESREFHNNIKDNIERSETFQTNVQVLLDHQNNELQTILNALRLYEAGYLSNREQIDTRIQEVLEEAKKAFTDIGDRNRELVEALGNPLRADLSRLLAEIRDTLEARLERIQNRFDQFDVPIKSAAEKIEGSLETVVNRTEKLTREMQREVLKQDEKNREQLEHLGELNEQIKHLLLELSKSNELYGEHAKRLSGDVNGLGQSFAAFGNSIVAFGQTLNLNGQHLTKLEQLDQQGKEIVSALNQLSRNSQIQNEQIRSLTGNMIAIERDLRLCSRPIQSAPTSAATENVSRMDRGSGPGGHSGSWPDSTQRSDRYQAQPLNTQQQLLRAASEVAAVSDRSTESMHQTEEADGPFHSESAEPPQYSTVTSRLSGAESRSVGDKGESLIERTVRRVLTFLGR